MTVFDKPGPENAETTLRHLRAAVRFATERDIRHLVVAYTVGETGVRAAALGARYSISVVIVSHNTRFKEPGEQKLTAENRYRIEDVGARVHAGTHALREIGSAIRQRVGRQPRRTANTLRIFGRGLKVCVEMAAMVYDAGPVPIKDIVCVAGNPSQS